MVEQDALGGRTKTHLVMVGVETAHQLPTIRLLLLLKLTEGRRERQEEEEEEEEGRRGAPAPHGTGEGQVCARRGRGLDCAPAHRLDWSQCPLGRTYNTPLLVCMGRGL